MAWSGTSPLTSCSQLCHQWKFVHSCTFALYNKHFNSFFFSLFCLDGAALQKHTSGYSVPRQSPDPCRHATLKGRVFICKAGEQIRCFQTPVVSSLKRNPTNKEGRACVISQSCLSTRTNLFCCWETKGSSVLMSSK